MNIQRAAGSILAATSLVLLSPNLIQAESGAPANNADPAAQAQAMQMVPGRAALIQTLDARKLKTGQQFKVRLADTVHLRNGSELPRGTTLLGMVSTDNLQPGNVKLVLDFNQAKLKNGKIVPIKATIVGLFPPQPENSEGYDIVAGDQQPNTWNDAVLQVDQVDAVSGVDLHSKIAAEDSGAFVTTKKGDVKLSSGSELLLAIAPQSKG